MNAYRIIESHSTVPARIKADRAVVDQNGCLLFFIGEELVCGYSSGEWIDFAKYEPN